MWREKNTQWWWWCWWERVQAVLEDCSIYLSTVNTLAIFPIALILFRITSLRAAIAAAESIIEI